MSVSGFKHTTIGSGFIIETVLGGMGKGWEGA